MEEGGEVSLYVYLDGDELMVGGATIMERERGAAVEGPEGFVPTWEAATHARSPWAALHLRPACLLLLPSKLQRELNHNPIGRRQARPDLCD